MNAIVMLLRLGIQGKTKRKIDCFCAINQDYHIFNSFGDRTP